MTNHFLEITHTESMNSADSIDGSLKVKWDNMLKYFK